MKPGWGQFFMTQRGQFRVAFDRAMVWPPPRFGLCNLYCPSDFLARLVLQPPAGASTHACG
jgi:hypothetical protein